MTSPSLLCLVLVSTISLCAQAPMTMPAPTHMAAPNPGEKKVEAPEVCQRCGMNRTKFAYSRMIVTYEDGTMVGTCSLHCAAAELGMNKGKPVKTLFVADYSNKKKRVDAKTATWVIGGSQKGVMTMVPKWAFEKQQDAEMFMQMNGGKLATYDEAMAMAGKELKP